ncbi:hypothetical protein [Herbaspirillum frisingense]|uniref:hypothetical protein n=1 Tax=Herbaspirillum frisingense TaxID=92645 RepID=UPI001F2CC27A|nr:hypothetical protein [Herbaspirillum frisingense]UIN23510.1 hypothetical protein LAZ82_10610 [Herbaspirillum frisingense]
MRKSLLLLVAVVFTMFLSACSKPQDIVFGPEPLKQIAEQGDQFKKLPEEDRTLLVSYLGLAEIGKAFGADIKPATGRTVGEVLVDARAWRERVKAAEAEKAKREAEAAELRQRVLAERKAVAERIAASALVAVTDKSVLPKNYDIGRYSPMLTITYAVENRSDKTIRQIKGAVTFKDASGDTIGTLYADIDEPVKPGQTLRTNTGRGWKLNEFMNEAKEKIAGRDSNSMTATFEASSIAFEGGEVIKAPELP